MITISLFTIGSIYSTYASGVEQMTETNNWNQTLQVKNPNWQEANQLAIYKRGRGFELGTSYHEQIQLAVRAGLELGASEMKVQPLTTWPSCILLCDLSWKNH